MTTAAAIAKKHADKLLGLARMLEQRAVVGQNSAATANWADVGDLAHLVETVTDALIGEHYRDGEGDAETANRIHDIAASLVEQVQEPEPYFDESIGSYIY
jgi:hypothetical protein